MSTTSDRRTGICPRCGGRMNRRSTMCFDCSLATRSERHKRNTGPKPRLLVDRLLARLETEGECVVWTGFRDRKGYGYISGPERPRHPRLVHRVAYELFVGPIPQGMTVDHLCFNRACVNAFHLELCTNAENVRRAANRRRYLSTAPLPEGY